MQPEANVSVLPLRRPCRNSFLTCLEQSCPPLPMAPSRPGAPIQHRYLTPSPSVPTLTTSDVSPTGTLYQILTLFIDPFHGSRDQGWVASASFARTIKLWDLSHASQATTTTTTTTQPTVTFTPPETSGAKALIYALAVYPPSRAHSCLGRS